jgi:hypothetical protein
MIGESVKMSSLTLTTGVCDLSGWKYSSLSSNITKRLSAHKKDVLTPIMPSKSIGSSDIESNRNLAVNRIRVFGRTNMMILYEISHGFSSFFLFSPDGCHMLGTGLFAPMATDCLCCETHLGKNGPHLREGVAILAVGWNT